MGQQESSCQPRQPIKTHRSYEPPLKIIPEARIEHEGLLRLQSIPFKNSIEINCNHEALFLENVDITLRYLIDSRLHSTKLFPFEDMQRLIESVTFTLAYLQSKGITYRDVCSDYMHYDEGSFKLLPNELIQTNTYQKLIENQRFTHASPELIIAMRYGEKSVIDEQILQKSNVFCLGMMLLEATTLLPASECYDPQTYDILDSVINERIVLVEQFYDDKIARIIANMLDYDYSQRMTLKELAVWVNRELRGEQNTVKSKNLPSCKSSSQVSVTQNSLSKSKIKNNSVYMQPKEDISKDERNKIYLAENEYMPKPQYTDHSELTRFDEKKKKPHQFQRKKSSLYLERDLKENKERVQLIPKQSAFTSYENPYSYAAQKKTAKYTDEIKESAPLKERNRFYPAVEDIFKARPALKEAYFEQEEDSQPTAKIRKGMEDSLEGDRSINRIKEEIEKSRRLIEEFRRNEGIKH